MPRGVPQIEVTFDVNSDGIMHVFAVETSSGKSEKITIKNDRGNLSTEDIDRMVAEVSRRGRRCRRLRHCLLGSEISSFCALHSECTN